MLLVKMSDMVRSLTHWKGFYYAILGKIGHPCALWSISTSGKQVQLANIPVTRDYGEFVRCEKGLYFKILQYPVLKIVNDRKCISVKSYPKEVLAPDYSAGFYCASAHYVVFTNTVSEHTKHAVYGFLGEVFSKDLEKSLESLKENQALIWHREFNKFRIFDIPFNAELLKPSIADDELTFAFVSWERGEIAILDVPELGDMA